MSRLTSRRTWLAIAAGAMALPRGLSAALRRRFAGPHPTPRAGITAAKVATHEQIGDRSDIIELFDHIREIPEIADGIRCQCPCNTIPDYYSLLSCYEAPGMMATFCAVCQGQGRLVYRLHKAGQSLDAIRRGVEAKFG